MTLYQTCTALYLIHEESEVLGLWVEVEVELDVGGVLHPLQRGQVGARHQDRAARGQAHREGVQAVAS